MNKERVNKFIESKTIQEINSEIEKAQEELNKLWREYKGDDCENHIESRRPFYELYSDLLTAKTMLVPTNDVSARSRVEEDDTLMTTEEFQKMCEYGMFKPDAGTGYYASKDFIYNLMAEPEAFINGFIRNDFEYVVWYNK